MFGCILLACLGCCDDEVIVERRQVVRSYVVEEPVVRVRVRRYRVRSYAYAPVYRDSLDDDAIIEQAIADGARKVEIKRTRRKVKVEIKR